MELHLAGLTALWPVIDLLECPRRAQPALNRLITPDPYPANWQANLFLYTARQANFSWPCGAISHLRGRRWNPFPQVRWLDVWESVLWVKQSVKQQRSASKPLNLLGEWNVLKYYVPEDKELLLKTETAQVLWENCFLIRSMPLFPTLTLYHCTDWL